MRTCYDSKSMSYEVLARKYRPTNFEEVIGQDHIVKALVNGINAEKMHQAYIFAGTRGIGKTTLARILAKCMNCESDTKPTSRPCNKCSNTIEISSGRSVDFLEIDAASNTQVDKIRDLIETVEYKPAKGRFKIYLIDEVHMLSTASFNALLKTLEEPPAHVIFIFATTNPEKIPKTVQSRCLQLNLKTVSDDVLFDHFKKILKKEKIKFDDESVKLIANFSNGSVRDGLTLLDQAIAYGNGELLENEIKSLLGTIDDTLLIELIEHILIGDGKKVFDLLSKIEELTPEYDVILKDLISILHKISLEQVLSNSENKNIKSLANKIDKEFCQLLYEISMNAYSKFTVHPNPKESLEICLLRMLAFNPLQKLSDSNNSINEKNIVEKKTPKKEINSNQSKDIPKKNFLINENNDWIKLFNSLDLSPFARSYFGSMSFDSQVNSTLVFIANESIGQIPENISTEFKSELESKFSQAIDIEIRIGKVMNCPIDFEEKKKKLDQDNATADINNNKDIQSFLKKFKGKIKEDSVKPIK